MPELHLERTGDDLSITLDEYSATIPFADVALRTDTWESIDKDAAAYGRALFDTTFRDEQLRARLSSLPANARLVLVADDAPVASVPWEYLRDQHGKLLASRLTFVRGLPENERRESFSFAGPLEIVVVPVSPVDEPRVLNVEREWRDLVDAVTSGAPTEALALKRVRPPTRVAMEGAFNRRATSIVHFMGHSASHDGQALLVFEDARAWSSTVDAADFGDALPPRVLLVVLNSCLSAIVAPTELGNIARSLVRRGIPYALGTQCFLPDDAALVLSKALYPSLLQGASVEEAVTHVRRSLEQPGNLSNAAWLAGIPVLYTSLHAPAPAFELSEGKPAIQPDPEHLEQTVDCTALPKAEHFVGRSSEIRQVLDALLSPRAHGFVLLHGLGGIGKTAIAQVVAERVGWFFQDRELALSFETFASIDGTGEVSVKEQFVERFTTGLARFYGLDPAQYLTPPELQQAILQRRTHLRSLLILDNIETLIDAQKRNRPTALALAAFIARLKEGDGAILLTSRTVPPSDWGDCQVVSISSLSDEAGADLFLALLPDKRKGLAPPVARMALSRRVQGHPLSIRLLAGRFADESVTDLATFLQQVEAELEQAEQQTPSSLEDPERQRTLYACMDYSVRRLSPAQREVLDAVSLFQAPFLPEFVATVMHDEEQTPIHLQNLVRLGLLTETVKTFKEGELAFLELHSMLRWYIQHHLPPPETMQQERYGELYERLARRAYEFQGGYDQSSLTRYLVRQSLPDFEAALAYLPLQQRSNLAYHLTRPYERMGQNRHALALYEQALEIDQELGDKQAVAMTQNRMANVLGLLGRPQEALALYEQNLRAYREVNDAQGIATTQHMMGLVLTQVGKPQEALALFQQVLQTMQELGVAREIAITQKEIADVYQQSGKPQEALTLYGQALHTMQESGDARNVALVQSAMARTLVELGKPQEALKLYGQALDAYRALEEVRSVAVIQASMAHVLSEMGRPQEAMTLQQEALRTLQEVGDLREIAGAQQGLAAALDHEGKPQEALALYQQALQTTQDLGDMHGTAAIQASMAGMVESDKPQEALALYQQALHTLQALGDVRGVAAMQGSMAGIFRQLGKPQEALAFYQQALQATQALGDLRGSAVTQNEMALMLRLSGKPQEAVTLYEQALHSFQELEDAREVALTQQRLAEVLVEQGKPQAALALYEQALHTYQALGERHGEAVTQSSMAKVQLQIGKPQEALILYQEALRTFQALGDMRDTAVTQNEMANVLAQMGKPQEALILHQEALHTLQALGDVREVAVTQNSVANVLVQLDKPEEALALYERSLLIDQELGDMREVAATQSRMAAVLLQHGKFEEALALYRQSIPIAQQIGDVGGVAAMQNGMAIALIALGKPQEAMGLCEQALRTNRELGNVREIAVTQSNIGSLLLQQGEPQRALEMLWDAYTMLNQNGFVSDAQNMQQWLLLLKSEVLGPAQFDTLWQQAGKEAQPGWLREIRASAPTTQAGIPSAELKAIAENTIAVMTRMPEKRDEWRTMIDGALKMAQRINRTEEAEFFSALLALLDHQAASLPINQLYANQIHAIQVSICCSALKVAEKRKVED